MSRNSKQYLAACETAEAAIREAMRLAPTVGQRELWEAALGRAVMSGRGWNAKPASKDRIRALLERAGLSQLAAAEALGVNPRTMRRYALGEAAIPDALLGRLERLAEEVESNGR